MQRSGSPSWSLSVSDEESLDLALYVRDALRLDTTADPIAPPPLLNKPPNRSDLVDGSEVGAVAKQWAAWWRIALAFAARWRGQEPGPDFVKWVAARSDDAARTVGEAPDFAALDTSPALQQAVVALHEDARRWFTSADRAEVDAGAPYDLVRSAADETITHHGVSPDQVNGIVFVVAVDGLWWRLMEPGVVVCSSASLRDWDAAAELLHEMFKSGLEGKSR